MSATELTALSTRALADGIRQGVFSSEEVVAAHLQRIDALGPSINAVVSLRPEQALAEARERDRERAAGILRGPLHGVPTAVKDLMDVAGFPTSHGSLVYGTSTIAQADSVIAGRLRQAGVVFVGKTNTPEFGAGSHTFNEVFGATRNPYDTSRSVGGSSGGAAAAVTTGMLPFADASDLGGSIRNPASFANLVGLRPTAGRVASARPGNTWDPGSVLGALTRDVADTGLILSVIAGPEPRAPLSIDEDPALFLSLRARSFRGARIAFSPDLGGLPLDPQVREATRRAAELAARLGAQVEEVTLDLSEADLVFETFRSLEFLDAHGEDAREHPDLVKRTVRDDVQWGEDLDAARIVAAAAARTRLFRQMQALFTDFDMLLAPTTQVLPFPVEWEYPTEIDGAAMERYYTWQRSCSRITATAMPALSMPFTFSAQGLPIGVQFVGPYRGDRLLLEFALTWESAVAEVMARRPEVAA